MNVQEPQVRVRRMSAADLERVLEIAASLPEAPRWPVSAYVAAMNPENRPRRIALLIEAVSEGVKESTQSSKVQTSGAEQTREKGSDAERTNEERTAGAKAHVDFAGLLPGINPRPTARMSLLPARMSFSAACKGLPSQDAGRVLGFAVAGLILPEAELETIVVAPQHQRRGLGAFLVRALAEELRKVQVSELILEVRASNRTAVGFYRAYGFEEAGRRVRYYADPEEDAVLMRLKLE